VLDVELEFLDRFIELGSQMVFPFGSHSDHETHAVVDVEEGYDVGNRAFFLLGLLASLLLDAHEDVGKSDEGSGVLKKFFLSGVAAYVGEVEFAAHVHDAVPFNYVSDFLHQDGRHFLVLIDCSFEHVLTAVQKIISSPEGGNPFLVHGFLFGDFPFLESAFEFVG
jgi:hypothetical protein